MFTETTDQLDGLLEVHLASGKQGDTPTTRSQLVERRALSDKISECPGRSPRRYQVDDECGAGGCCQSDRRHCRQNRIRRPHPEHGMSPLPNHDPNIWPWRTGNKTFVQH
jgi:hypothetical protein